MICLHSLPTFTTMSANKLYTSLNNTSQLSQDVGPQRLLKEFIDHLHILKASLVKGCGSQGLVKEFKGPFIAKIADEV